MLLDLLHWWTSPYFLYCSTGVVLASLSVSFGVTGYSLPWDQKQSSHSVSHILAKPDISRAVNSSLAVDLNKSTQILIQAPTWCFLIVDSTSLCDILR